MIAASFVPLRMLSPQLRRLTTALLRHSMPFNLLAHISGRQRKSNAWHTANVLL